MLNQFSCPKCKGELFWKGAEIRCLGCEFIGHEKEGIIDLRCGREDYYFNPVPRSMMRELVRETTPEKWPDVIRRFMAAVKNNPDWADNLVVNGRYAWKVFLTLPKDGVGLDIGAGLGNLVHNLAPHVGKFYAMDLTFERLQFSRLRFSLFNETDNIELIAGGEGKYLPFPDKSLDFVSLSGVLEWIPEDSQLWEDNRSKLVKLTKMMTVFFGTKNPRNMQIAFLKEIRRVLKEDGQLFIAIENRLSYEYFTGRKDHHSCLKYGSLLPRFLANLYSIWVNRKPYRTYTHSRIAYKRLLDASGFERTRFLGLLDGYSKLKEIIPLDFGDRGWRTDDRAGVLKAKRRHKNHVPAYGIVAGSASALEQPSFFDRLIEHISLNNEKLGAADLGFTRFLVTGSEKGVIFAEAGNDHYVIKLPYSETSLDGEVTNAAILKYLLKVKDIPVNLPNPIQSGHYQQLPYFVETRCRGELLAKTLDSGSRLALVKAGFSVWKELVCHHQLSQTVIFNNSLFDATIKHCADKIKPYAGNSALLDNLVSNLQRNLIGSNIRVGIQHGNYGAESIMIHESQVSALIGWEKAVASGLSILDMINLLISAELVLSDEADVFDITQSLIQSKWNHFNELDYLEQSFQLCGIETRFQDSYLVVYWLYRTAAELEKQKFYPKVSLVQRVDEFLDWISGADDWFVIDRASRSDLINEAEYDRKAKPFAMA